MDLPRDFLNKMKGLLKDEYELFYDAYSKPKYSALRVNTLKLDAERFKEISPFELEQVPWAKEGFYYREDDTPGKHPYHYAGLYYIQEPSAMAAVQALQVKPGEKVLDLCAAPGGKSTQIACCLRGQGLLVSNEIISSRASVLVQNMERFGVRNAVITNESPDRLSKVFTEFFDKILVDAPCSGEGMFRKDPKVCLEWKEELPFSCAKRQLKIMLEAEKMLKPGGKLVYSTCTFSPEENEGVIENFLQLRSNMEICDIVGFEDLGKGRPDWIGGRDELKKCRRIWPHRQKGEGHFIALMEKKPVPEGKSMAFVNIRGHDRGHNKNVLLYKEFEKNNLNISYDTPLHFFKNDVYIVPEGLPPLGSLRVLKPGLHLGLIKKDRFEPSHSLAMALEYDDFIRKINFGPDCPEIMSYLKGETLDVSAPRGWTAVMVNGFSLGWGKVVEGVLKNHYPKGLRINY
ncbi:MAG: NOL1/NOP2/sun family putative RNA methylase [Clostridiaceae bacterium]|nr:NOL1/NOP2/sun family putative RNA methylase [Clostridiaceae bacterium]